MKPNYTSQWALQYASSVSPWWLLLALPLIVAVGWFLYRKEQRVLAGWHAVFLPLLRCAFLAGVVFLAFRPSVVLKKILTYPGRILILLDDSESMSVCDNRMDEHDAVNLRRRLRGAIAGAPQPFYDLAMDVQEIAGTLRRFQSLSRDGDRQRDTFWHKSEAIQSLLLSHFDHFFEFGGSMAGLSMDMSTDLAALTTRVTGLKHRSDALFIGDRHLGGDVFDSVCDDLATAATALHMLQARLDDVATEAGGAALAAAADEIRGTSRLALLTESITASKDELAALLPSQRFQVKRLIDGSLVALSDFSTEAATAQHGETDFLEQGVSLLSELNPFPVAAMLLATDGRDLCGVSPDALIQVAVRKQVPLCTAGVGSLRGPLDAAVLEVEAPPYGVQKSPVRVRVRVKTALVAGTHFRVRIRQDETVLTEQECTSSDASEVELMLSITPHDVGVFRYTVDIPSVDGEVFPRRNNEQDFVVQVREHKAKVLFLDWKPRWETRFALNILGRLDYVELNAIVVLAQEGAELLRGSQKGTWPRDLATLETYDLVVIGDVPAGMLTPEEWDGLRTFVEEKGRSILFLKQGAPVGMTPEVADALYPLDGAAKGTAESVEARNDLQSLCLTDAGAFHSLTRRLVGELSVCEQNPSGLGQGLLLAEPGGAPLLAMKYCGQGKSGCLATDTLWLRLNPVALDAHTAVYVNLVSWALDADGLGEDPKRRQLLLDDPVLTTREPLQVWSFGLEAGTTVEALFRDEVVGTAPVSVQPDGVGFGRAVFKELPPGVLSIRMAGEEQVSVGPLHILDRYQELNGFARDEELLSRLSEDTGGETGSFVDMARLLAQVEPKDRVEKTERVFRLWDSWAIMMLMALVLTIEWVWRKSVGLV